MKKAAKRIIGTLSAICIAVSMLLVWDTPAQAATTAVKVPAKVHIGVKQLFTGGITAGQEPYNRGIKVEFPYGDYRIQNVKSSSKNLTCQVVYIGSRTSIYGPDSDGLLDAGWIGLYAKKKGTYKVTFDVVEKNTKVTKSYSVKVYANDEVGVKEVAFAGKTEFTSLHPNRRYFISAVEQSKSGVFKVTMNKGYKLKSITMTTYDKSGKEIQKKIKNGAKVKLGKYRDIIKWNPNLGNDTEDCWMASLLATTTFEIVYKDKYSGQTLSTYCVFSCFPKN